MGATFPHSWWTSSRTGLSGSNAVESNSDKGLLDLNEIEKVLTDPRADDVKVIIKVILKNKIVNIVFLNSINIFLYALKKIILTIYL